MKLIALLSIIANVQGSTLRSELASALTQSTNDTSAVPLDGFDFMGAGRCTYDADNMKLTANKWTGVHGTPDGSGNPSFKQIEWCAESARLSFSNGFYLSNQYCYLAGFPQTVPTPLRVNAAKWYPYNQNMNSHFGAYPQAHQVNGVMVLEGWGCYEKK